MDVAAGESEVHKVDRRGWGRQMKICLRLAFGARCKGKVRWRDKAGMLWAKSRVRASWSSESNGQERAREAVGEE